ncbi:MAG: hypothetical protein NT167_13575 [Verrucomicrobia bacterium]|nr:hypothetical protein [Verrucomicrobiota bacterium]
MQEYVEQSCAILGSEQDLVAFGELLHQTWLAKRGLSAKVSNPQVDALYDAARSAGAIGGKLLGAGGGGFLLFFVPPERQKKVRQQLKQLIHVPFAFESSGSQIIFFDMEEDFAKHDKVRASQQIEAFREWNPELPGNPTG